VTKKYLITSALPYANGPLHFGHMAGAILPADVYNRHRKMQGHETLYICGSDEHGVAIMLSAQKAGMSYQEWVDKWHKYQKDLFASYGVEFNFYGQTSSEYHKEEVIPWFNDLYEKGAIEPRASKQHKCQDCSNYLPDRFVEGTCYVCKYEHARGDECPDCGTWIEAVKLIDPVCKICDSKNLSIEEVTQYYLKLSKYHTEYRKWFETKKGSWRKTVVPFVDALSKEELVDRAITRDLDWGIDVPLAEAKGKKLYVWFDAPIGYVSNTKEYFKQINSTEHYLDDWWKSDDVVISHFLGKDNIIFHAITFPTMCMVTGFANLVDDLPANQFLNLQGRQFSKSQGWYVDAEEALTEFGVDALRYYLIGLIPENQDTNFIWKQFATKVNNELANNVGNMVNRCLKFGEKKWPSGIEADRFSPFFASDIKREIESEIKELNALLDKIQIKKALEKLMHIGSMINIYFTEKAPWAQFKANPDQALETIASSTLLVTTLAVLFKPFLPNMSSRILGFFEAELDAETERKVYLGDLDALRVFIKGGFKLGKPPEVLVPKIDMDVIAEKESALEALSSNNQ
jgi:methionyl-tRNA synthetase